MLVPGSASPLLFHAAAGGGGAYEVSRSVRFNSVDSAYLSRTPASAGNRKTWTWAGWVKRSALGTYQYIWGNGNASAENGFFIRFDNNDVIRIGDYSNTSVWSKVTTQVFRDVSAWYHILISYDTTNATAADRVRLYVNGSRISAFSTSTDPTQNYDGYINNTNPDSIGRWGAQAAYYLDGYLADIHFIDGQALTPSSFGEFDTNNVWQPKAFSGGSYGTNGFRLDFADNSSAAALGYDAAGSNDWTVNNLSVTAGSGNDSLRDSPTNGSQTDTGVGGEVVGNYCTWNPLKLNTNGSLANGNLDWSSSTGGGLAVGTIGVASGKWYWEISVTGGSNCGVGVFDPSAALTTYIEQSTLGISYYGSAGSIFYSGGSSSYGASFGSGDSIGVALDLDNGKIYFSKNGTWQNSGNPATQTNPARTGLAGTYAPAVVAGASSAHSASLNAGQRPFAYTAPSGFKALCTTNLPAPTIANGATVMDVKLYTGNGSTQTISGLGFSPDLVWIKRRSVNSDHNFFDIVRGATNVIKSNNTDAEVTASTSLTTFNSDGFSVGSNSDVNGNTHPIVAWTWDAGTSNATNTSGTITSTVRANISAGFSVVTWTGGGSGYSVGHGLGVAPKLIIIKDRNNAFDWIVFTTVIDGSLDYLYLNSTDAKADSGGSLPTSTLVYPGQSTSSNYVMYCFAPVAGYSAFGSYVGNGSASDGPFVHTGFRPKFTLVKANLAGEHWSILDSARNTFNVTNTVLRPNLSNEEGTEAVDFLSNGFKPRNAGGEYNASGTTYLYAAFAEHPFGLARAR